MPFDQVQTNRVGLNGAFYPIVSSYALDIATSGSGRSADDRRRLQSILPLTSEPALPSQLFRVGKQDHIVRPTVEVHGVNHR